MKKVTLGRTGLEVTQLAYGAMELRGTQGAGGRLPDEEHAGVVLNAVLDAGINFIDTSWCYGRSEEFIGRYVSHRRSEFYISTKCGHYWRDDPQRSGWSREGMMNCIQESLERLRTDHVDILQLHNATPADVHSHGCIDTLKDIQSQGMARFIGVSTTLPHLDEFLETGVFDTFQIPYSALQPEHHDAIQRLADAGAGTIIRGGVAQGSPVQPESRRTAPGKERWEKSGLAELVGDADPVELLLRYTLSHPGVQTTIVGTQNVEHLAANVEAAEKGALEAATVEAVRQRVGG